MEQEVKKLVEISKFAGERFDLVQAGGGNTSVKLGSGEMLVKASGFILSDVGVDRGFAKVRTSQVADILENNMVLECADKRKKEAVSKKLVEKATISRANRPSIETLLHSILGKYVLHTHPLTINMVVIRPDWKKILSQLFGKEIALVGYKTPGVELAIQLKVVLDAFTVPPKIIFLQNHGLLISSDNTNEIKDLTDYVCDKIAAFLGLDMSRYKYSNLISHLINKTNDDMLTAYLSEDEYINRFVMQDRSIFFASPFCPDKVVYCGISSAELYDLDDDAPIKTYLKNYRELPKVVLYEDNVYLIAKNVRKAKEVEELLKFHVLALHNQTSEYNLLETEELSYLSNWESEKYRRDLS